MKAANTPEYGPANVIEVVEKPKPQIGDDEILIEVHASAVTAGDRRLRSADFPGISAILGRLVMGISAPRNPVQGTMFAGRVVEIGKSVASYHVGDDVFGSTDHSAYAEFLSVAEDGPMAKIPPGVTYEEAAAVPYGAVTSLIFLRDLGELAPGERVLLVGGTGGVGRYAIQIAKQMGADVTVVCGTSDVTYAEALGADHVIDYKTTDFSKTGELYDLIFDIADASSFSKSRNSLNEGGRYLTLYISMTVIFQMLFTSIFGSRKAKFGIAMGSKDDMRVVATMMEERAVVSTVEHRFPLAQIAEAHAVGERGVRGDIVVTMVEPPAQKLRRVA